MVYVLLAIFALLLFLTVKPRKQQVVWSVILLVFMMFLVGMRNETVGVDSLQYTYRFSLDYDLEGLFYEPLYQLSVIFVSSFTNEYGWWFLLMSFITFLPLGIAICGYSKMPLLSVLIYMVSTIHLFPENMNIMRQSVAISCLLLSYLTFINKHRIVALLLFIIAFGFHFSSLIVLPFYFLNKVYIKKPIILFSLASTFIIGFFSSRLLSVDLIGHLFPQLGGAAEVGLEKLSNNYGDKTALNAFGLIATMLPINLLCVFLIPSKNDEESYNYLFNFFFVGTIISNIIYCAIPFGFRFSYPFFVVESILFAYKYKTNKLLRIYLIFIIILFFEYLIQLSLSDRPNMIIPYKFNELFVVI